MPDIGKIKRLNKKILKLETKARTMQLQIIDENTSHEIKSQLRKALFPIANELAELRKELEREKSS